MYRLWMLSLLAISLAMCTAPKALFEPPMEVVAGEEVQFQNNSLNGETYLWDFGDGQTSTDPNPSHSYWQSGRYSVSLTVTSKSKKNTKTMDLYAVPPKECLAVVSTNHGDIVIKLYDDTPQHRDNFQELVDEKFYDNLLFHRVIDGFMIQGGDPGSADSKPGEALGSGGPGYQIKAEIDAGHVHTKGALAAARQGDMVNPEKKSSGSQFYIVHGKSVTEEELSMFQKRTGIVYTDEQKEKYLSLGGTPFLDGQYTVFGEVVKGLDVIDKIAKVPTDRRDRPNENVVMSIKMIQ